MYSNEAIRQQEESPRANGTADDIAVRVNDLSKCYHIYDRPQDRLKQSIFPRLQRLMGWPTRQYHRDFWALKDVSLEVKRGETIGIIGRNGSGKSTLLQLICGTLAPTSGSIETNGRIAALLELGSGFNPDFTGRENVYMNAAVLGLSRDETDSRFDEIAAFADIGQFIDQPLKTYSSGMAVRLAFAVSVCVEPDILVVDEALAVGDMAFQFKCLDRLRTLTASGTTLLFVSHDIGMVKSFCDSVLYLAKGTQRLQGLPDEVAELYFMEMRDEQRRSSTGKTGVSIKRFLGQGRGTAFGTDEGHIVAARFTNSDGLFSSFAHGEEVEIEMEAEYSRSVSHPCLSLYVQNHRFLEVSGGWCFLEGQETSNGRKSVRVYARFPADLAPGRYHITVRLENRGSDTLFEPIDKQVGLLSFEIVRSRQSFLGVVDLQVRFRQAQSSGTQPASSSFCALMNSLRGGITPEEGAFLRRLASTARNGCIVEVGSFRGKSAVALAHGVREQAYGSRPAVYCIEPHRPFVGIYGGKFGPVDRGAFYETMCKTGVFDEVALINRSSEQVTLGWDEPVSLLFIDGDHRYESVRRDFACWDAHLALGGVLAFDDATDPAAGPYRLIDELLGTGRYRRLEAVGKIVALSKLRGESDVFEHLPAKPLRVLVPCHNIVLSGGLLRFDRVGKVLRDWGHEVVFVPMAQPPEQQWQIDSPVLSLDLACDRRWDVVMVPGAGFPDETISKFAVFRDRKFGTRVQHVLNDQTRHQDFILVNRTLAPDIVIFNNRDWAAGSFTDFDADRFHVLLGGVDASVFHPTPYRTHPLMPGRWVVGGSASKHPEPLVQALAVLPGDVVARLYGYDVHGLAAKHPDLLASGRLELTGPLRGDALSRFYRNVDCIAMTETHAGWSNLVAEAMASGVPVVCTPKGTAAIACHEETALVVNSPTPDALAAALLRLRGDAALCRRLTEGARASITNHSWDTYARELLKLVQHNGQRYYTYAPDLGLHGKWPIEERLDGLEFLLQRVRGLDVIDFGTAEGVVAREFLRRGARKITGVDVDPGRVNLANALCAPWHGTEFRVADISNWAVFRERNKDLLNDSYDVVLYLGLHHHLPPESRRGVLTQVMRLALRYFAIRTSTAIWEADDIDSILSSEGFRLVSGQESPEKAQHLAPVRIYAKNVT